MDKRVNSTTVGITGKHRSPINEREGKKVIGGFGNHVIDQTINITLNQHNHFNNAPSPNQA
jgi:hypothetical protein